VDKGPKIICRKSASKMDTDFALVVCIANFTNYLLEGVVALDVNTPSMISQAAGLD
jgi:hypothetical protein